MSGVWGADMTDYITKIEGVCEKCRLPCQDKNDQYFYYGYTCGADFDIKYNYNSGRMKRAIDLLRGLPSELLKDYLDEERRTPTALKVVILNELKCRGEYEKMPEVMKL